MSQDKTTPVDLGEYPLVQVEWLDARSDTGWREITSKLELTPCVTVGRVVVSNKQMVVLAGTIQVIRDEDDKVEVGEIIAIPRGCIQSIRGLKETPKC